MKILTDISWSDLRARARAAITKKRLLIAGGVVLAFLVLTPILTYLYYAHDISNRDRLMNRNDTGIILRDRHGKVFYEYGTVNLNDDVPLSKISDHVEHALVASEDSEFYHHPGFSVRGIVRAMYADVVRKDPTAYGGSTITQQLVKNKLLSSNKNYFRKYQEVAMAIAVERQYTKDQILDMYLNSVYFGEGAFGIAEASKVYFNKTPQDLTLSESALLVGLLPAPSAYSPLSGDQQLALKQQDRVLTRMVGNHYISRTEKQQAEDQPLVFAKTSPSKQRHAQHYAQMVIEQLNKKYGEERITRSGYDVTTGLDLNWQKQAETIVKQQVERTKSLGGRNASLVAEDPTNGEVRALVGSVDWNNPEFGQVNMATSPRQPGSSFKPIYYSKAIEDKLVTAATILDDSPKTFGNSYRPTDFDNRFEGKMTLRSALAESRNVPAVEVMQKLGVKNAVQAAQEMGLTNVDNASRYGLSLALGTAEVRLTNLVNAYSAFADQGEQHQQTLITKIEDKFGKTVYHYKPTTKRVRSAGSAYIINSILSDPAARAPTYGRSMNLSGRPVALKTGTTNDVRDGWTIGYTPNLAVGVWMGNNEHEPMIDLGSSTSAGVIWKQTMRAFLKDLPIKQFEPPHDVVRLTICRGTELRAMDTGSNTFKEYFIRGTEPSGTCNAHQDTPDKAKPQKEKEQPDDKKKPSNTNGSTDTTNGGTNDTPDCTTNPDDPACNTVDCTTNPDDPACDTPDCTTNPDDPACDTTNGSGTGGGGTPTP
jgi:1A family penicillin-binding protein